MLNFCDLIQLFVFTTNHHLKPSNKLYPAFLFPLVYFNFLLVKFLSKPKMMLYKYSNSQDSHHPAHLFILLKALAVCKRRAQKE